MIYRYVIPCTPITKKNSQQIIWNKKENRPLIIQSERYKEFEDIAPYYLRPRPEKPIDYPVTVKCIYYRETKRKVDTSNLDAAMHDVLVRCKILEDDNRDIIASTDGTRTYWDKKNPRIEIEISPYEGEYEQWKKR